MALLPLCEGVLPVCLLEVGELVLAIDAKLDHYGVGVGLWELAKALQHLHHFLSFFSPAL